ncbi:hypothetical protein ACFOET_19350 [Parapedobacter deserti]|uniref:Uncharacterized protein n=1 Tax=Parapedobacter deserti TaxID=1912957 RepID=A0ABV7JSA5_9SPHI
MAELGSTELIYALYLFECGETAAMNEYLPQKPFSYPANLFHRLLHLNLLMRSIKLEKGGDCKKLGQQAIVLCETHGFKLLEAYFRMLTINKVPKNERSYHFNILKFQFTTFGYTMGLKSLQKNTVEATAISPACGI